MYFLRDETSLEVFGPFWKKEHAENVKLEREMAYNRAGIDCSICVIEKQMIRDPAESDQHAIR